MRRLLLLALIAACALVSGCDTMPEKDPGYYVMHRGHRGDTGKETGLPLFVSCLPPVERR